MQRVRPLLAAALAVFQALAASARADEPARKYQVVSPKDDAIIAAAINGTGEIVGLEWVEEKASPGVVSQVPFYARGKEMTYLPLLEGYTATAPAALSDDGRVVGRASKPGRLGVRVLLRNQAFIWEAGVGIRGLGALPGDNASFACGISRDGRRIGGVSIGDDRVRACVWERDGDGDGGRWTCAPLPHASRLGSNVVAISPDGDRVAAVDGVLPSLWSRDDTGRWTRETIGEADTLVPRAVNDAGTVVGLRYTREGSTHAVVWTREGGYRVIAEPAGYVRSEAGAVNNAGAVVGYVDGPNGSETGPRAFVHEGGRLRLLDEGGPAFTAATAVNDRGQVAGVLEKEDEPEPAPAPAPTPAPAPAPADADRAGKPAPR